MNEVEKYATHICREFVNATHLYAREHFGDAAHVYQCHAEATGCIFCRVGLGRVYFKGNGRPKDEELARACFGGADAMHAKWVRLMLEEIVDEIPRARGHADVLESVRRRAWPFTLNSLEVESEAFSALRSHPLAGVFDACEYTLGFMLECGIGGDVDCTRAALLYRHAAVAFRNASSACNAGWMYEKDWREQNLWRSAVFYNFGRSLQNSASANNLGMAYLLGNGVEESDARAFALFTEAVRMPAPSSSAVVNLARCYELSHGTERNLPLAVELYEQAARCGNADAHASLGLMYYTADRDVPIDTAKAWFHCTEAMFYGNFECRNMLHGLQNLAPRETVQRGKRAFLRVHATYTLFASALVVFTLRSLRQLPFNVFHAIAVHFFTDRLRYQRFAQWTGVEALNLDDTGLDEADKLRITRAAFVNATHRAARFSTLRCAADLRDAIQQGAFVDDSQLYW